MKAIILAGGIGSRLKDIGEGTPKCLLEFNSRPILEYQLEALVENNVTRLVIVTGYKGEMIKEYIQKHPKFRYLNINYIDNPDYATTSTGYGWGLAREYIQDEEDLIHFNSDLIFFPSLIKKVLEHQSKNVVLIDKNIELNDSMEQVILDSSTNRILKMDKANILGAHGKGVGVAKFSNEAVRFILDRIDNFVKRGEISRTDSKLNLYGQIRKAVEMMDFYGVDIGEDFFREVNTIEDYGIAQGLIKQSFPGFQPLVEDRKLKAIILAGGKGNRLKEFVDNSPVALLEYKGKPLLEYQLEALMENGVRDILIVLGYKGFMVKEFIKNHSRFNELNILFLDNDEYKTTGTSYAWWLTKDFIKDEEQILHIHSDLVFYPSLIKRILENEKENIIFIDKDVYLDKSMEQVILDSESEKILHMDKRDVPGAHGKGVGVAKFSNKAIRFMIDRIEKYLELGDKNQAFYGIIRKTIPEIDFHGIDIGGDFFREINTVEDYESLKEHKEKCFPKKVSVVMMYGLPGTGKTTCSRKIRDYFEGEVNVDVLSTFRIRDKLGFTDLNSEEQRDQTYEELAKSLEESLRRKIFGCVILDGNFNKKKRREKIYNLIKKYDANLYIVKCILESKEKVKERMEGRQVYGERMEHGAAEIYLHEMIGKDLEPIEEDVLPITPVILSVETGSNKISISPDNFLKGIIKSLEKDGS